jgi:hypothetical protein
MYPVRRPCVAPLSAAYDRSSLLVMARMWHAAGLDHLDANYRRVRRQSDIGSWQALSTVVHASGCVSLFAVRLAVGSWH